MRDMLQAAWHSGAYGYAPAYGFHHGFGGGGSWIGHMVVSSLVHGLIYGMIFRVLSHLSLGEIVLLVVVVVGGLYLWNRNTGYRRW